jgi:hypothetical protein
LGIFVLPDTAWWEYYTPMQERLRVLVPKYAGAADAEAVLKDCAEEIAAYRDHGMHFGYVFLVRAFPTRHVRRRAVLEILMMRGRRNLR